MDILHPLRGLLTPAMAGVLEVLTGTHTPLTGREVHRLVRGGSSLGAVQQALEGLASLGLVDVQQAGRARLHSLNRDHILAGPLLEMANAASSVERWLATALEGLDNPPCAAWLFGSTARGDSTSTSDIDLALIREEAEGTADQDISDLLESLRRRTGNDAEVLMLTMDELRGAVERGDAIVAELRRDARPLLGDSPRVLLRSGSGA